MKTMLSIYIAVIGCAAAAVSANSATVHYVNLNNPIPSPPFTNWATAANVIQDAVDASDNGAEIVVTNGVYQSGGAIVSGLSNRVAVTKALTLRSVNGPSVTIIRGELTRDSPGVRCVYLTNGAQLIGFTLTEGGTSFSEKAELQDITGGGAWCKSQDAILSNCILTGNVAAMGGGVWSGILHNCKLINNRAWGIWGNGVAPSFGGGAAGAVLNNCLLQWNFSNFGGGAAESTLNNCTLVENSASFEFMREGNGSGASGSTLNNCVVYFNNDPITSEPSNYSGCLINNSCTTPLPTNGVGNISDAPLFVDAADGNFRLQSDSPCINAGLNTYAPAGPDLDGNSRILGGTVDMGAYEFQSTVRYVDVNSANPTPPYSTWATAANVIQDAIDIALARDEVVVTNGVYDTGGRVVHGMLTNRVAVVRPLTLRSVNGPNVTVIRGTQGSGSINGSGPLRCAYLTNRANLIGFTLEGGTLTNYPINSFDRYLVSGGGIWCESESVTVSNCIVRGNSATFGGGVCQGTLLNCTLSNNIAQRTGGGSLLTRLIGCSLTSNSASFGGGARKGTLLECMLIGNSALYGGGAQDANLTGCELRDNFAAEQGGGARGGSLDNCLIANNRATDGGGAWGSGVYNCTVVYNTALYGGGISGVCYSGGGSPGCDTIRIPPWGFTDCVYSSAHISSSVIYFNNAPDAPNVTADGRNAFFLFPGDCNFIQFSCTYPLSVLAAGNITNAPRFVDPEAGDFRLQPKSPCINAGHNPYASVSLDLAGKARIVGGTVDIGAYEYQSPQSVISYGWLQQYGLPSDGSADLADGDHDRMNTLQEWRAGTDPFDEQSALRLLQSAGLPGALLVSWQSVSNRTYFLERSTHLTERPFEAVASNIVGQAGATVYTDTNAPGTGPFFYRVGVAE